MNKPHQRVGSKSNAHVGAAFEAKALRYFAKRGISLERNFTVEIGIGKIKKPHKFDLGFADPKIIVECKSHTWTAGGKVPSAKLTVWNEAMFYFHVAPPAYKKVLFVKHHRRAKGGESLLTYYRRTYGHLIPRNVSFIEFAEKTGRAV